MSSRTRPEPAVARAAPAAIEAVPVRHPGRWIGAAVVLVLVGLLVRSLAANPKIAWEVVREYLFNPLILQGVLVTIELTFVAMLVGLGLGIVLAVMRLSPNPVLAAASGAYIWFFRGTPVLVQLIFWYNLGLIFPRIGIGEFSTPAQTIITGFTAAMLGLGLNEGAYMAEIVRAGILSVDRGQTEAAQALGMTSAQTMRRIVLPQAMRVIIPPTGNEFISMLKTTSLVSVISGADLLTRAQNIYSRSFQVIELLMVASLWYLVLTSIASTGQYFIEQRYARGAATAGRGSLLLAIARRLLPARRGAR